MLHHPTLETLQPLSAWWVLVGVGDGANEA